MPTAVADDTYGELLRAYRARTGEEPSDAIAEILRMEADWLAMTPAEREHEAAEKLKALRAIRATFPPLSREEKDAVWAEVDRVNEELFEDPAEVQDP